MFAEQAAVFFGQTLLNPHRELLLSCRRLSALLRHTLGVFTLRLFGRAQMR